jgi:hypothetical protein
MARDKYKRPSLPAQPFMLVDDNGVEDGPFRAEDFQPLPDSGGVWVTQTDARPTFLRVQRQRGDEIWTVDGEGVVHHYRIAVLVA